MAKPRVFISSTYYDLKHIRKSIELFISEVGYETVLFENGDIPFDHEHPLDESCYKELESCQIFVLIIGGRYGSASSDQAVELTKDEINKHYKHYNSITKKEYEAARDRDIPIYIFVEKGVAAEYLTYKENKENDQVKYAHVDSVNIFRLLDGLYAEKRNNLIREFENVEDITHWLKDQWAGLFNQFLMTKTAKKQLDNLESKLTELGSVVATLQDYSETLLRQVEPEKSEKIIGEIKDVKTERDLFNSFLKIPYVDIFVVDAGIDEGLAFELLKNSQTTKDFYSTINEELKSTGIEYEFLNEVGFKDTDIEEFFKKLKNTKSS